MANLDAWEVPLGLFSDDLSKVAVVEHVEGVEWESVIVSVYVWVGYRCCLLLFLPLFVVFFILDCLIFPPTLLFGVIVWAAHCGQAESTSVEDIPLC